MKIIGMKTIMCVMAMLVAVGVTRADWYTADYAGNMLPTAATPGWTEMYSANSYTGGSDYTATQDLVDPGYLEINSIGSTAYRPYYTYSGTDWNPTGDAFTFEIRMKILDNTGFTYAFQIFAGDTTERFNVYGNTTSIFLGTQKIDLDATQWHVYHVIAEKVDNNWGYTLYVDNPDTYVSHTGYSNTGNMIMFGDTSASGTSCGGQTQIDYIRWNNSQAVPIVPEPATMTLLSVGAAFVFIKRSRNRA